MTAQVPQGVETRMLRHAFLLYLLLSYSQLE